MVERFQGNRIYFWSQFYIEFSLLIQKFILSNSSIQETQSINQKIHSNIQLFFFSFQILRFTIFCLIVSYWQPSVYSNHFFQSLLPETFKLPK